MNKILSVCSAFVPLKLRIYLFFLYKQHYRLSFSKPKTLSEKIQKRKLSLGFFEASLADKYKVRKYVENKIGGEFLIPLVGVYNTLNANVLSEIPENSVIKTTHGSGCNHIHFMSKDDDYKKVIEKFELALEESYIGTFFGEIHYDLIERKILIEERLDFNGDSPPDFKFHVLNKQGEFNWFLQVDFDRFIDHKRNYYNSQLQLLDFEVIYNNGDFLLPDQDKIYEMANLAIKLNGDMPYSRVDLYLHEGKIYFGEITLTPGSGFEKFSDKKYDEKYGELWG
ncbi:hypothetical protein D0856_14520 [Vibrio owensii]|uniref:ATP-grasp fold amidoligase family protein n=1 Tax=Vibrio owensii TaxID=696485 RepID=UPI000EFA5CA4|nr:ATP-grasp fold amidoligase family protein [Vibrio owensii]AYO21200.1 hypothetical protein D0856_14520 [Vibrio owensii]